MARAEFSLIDVITITGSKTKIGRKRKGSSILRSCEQMKSGGSMIKFAQ